MRFGVFPYKMGSNSARALADGLDGVVIRHQGSRYQKYSRPGWWTVNWGADNCPSGSRVLNTSVQLSRTRNKLLFFQLVKDSCRVPDFATNSSDAKQWLRDGGTVVCRRTLTGHSGQGIVMASRSEDVVQAPLFTRYIKKESEWRLHFFQGGDAPFFIQKKVQRKTDTSTEPNYQVRNLAGGWVYAHGREFVSDVPADVLAQGLAAFRRSGMDFGAFDLVYNQKQKQAYVLEVNSACGLEGATVGAYVAAFSGLTT